MASEGQQSKINQIKREIAIGDQDKTSTHELVLYIENDGNLYRQMTTPIHQNLDRKKEKGTFDNDLALVAFRNLADAGAKKYNKEYGGSFSVNSRSHAAKELLDSYLSESN